MVDIIAKTREDYNRIAFLYAKTRNAARELEQFESLLNEGYKVLDWGCGNGRLIYLLKGKKIEYYGIDQSREMINLAKQQFSKEVEEGWVHLICTEQEDYKFPANFFDRIFMIASFHHLPDTKSRLDLLKILYQELKEKGFLIATNWNLKSNWAQEKFEKDWKQIGENDYLIPWKSQTGEVLAERYYHHFTPEELQELFVATGFTIDEMYYARGVERVDNQQGKNLVVIVKK